MTLTNDEVQKAVNREFRRIRKEGKVRITERPRLKWMSSDLRKTLREFPERIPDFVENWRRLEQT